MRQQLVPNAFEVTDGLLPTLHLSVRSTGLRFRRSRGPPLQPDRRGDRALRHRSRQGTQARRCGDRGADRCCDRLHGGRLGQEGPGRQNLRADQSDAPPRPRFPDYPPDPPQAVRGPARRGARLHRRLCVPVRGDAALHRQEPDQPAEAIGRDPEDPVLRRARRLCRGGQSVVDLPGTQWRRVLQPQPNRPRVRGTSGRSGVPRRPRQFGARPRFVLNGTSTSNKVVLGALVTDGDLVLFDRNNHKAAHHGALMMAGGIPVYIPTVRNAWGLIGPMRWDALDETALRERIRNHPLVKDPDAWRKPRPFRVAVVEQCTYDGTIHNREMILKRIGHLCEYILFDEAWAGFMKFHPLYAGRFAMGLSGLTPDAPGIIATQSTHKQLASFSQASQIHIKDRHIRGQKRRIEHRRFNESFMQHASTSPFYPLFASLDVGAQMMKGRSGEVLWDDTIRLGIELRKKIRATRREFEDREKDPARRWFFEAFVPDRVTLSEPDGDALREVAWEDVPTDDLVANAHYWELSPGARWHGFSHVAPGYAITDPNKLTLLTPGFDRGTGAYADYGIPAPVVAQYLRANRVVPEKNDLNSLLFLLTPGVESSKAGTLLSALVAFKKLHDDNARLDDAIGEFVRRRPARYAGLRMRELCAEMHGFFRDNLTNSLQRAQFASDHLPTLAMPTHHAVRQMVRNNVDYLPVDQVFGRVATTMFVVYPPGIATIVPGERLDERARPMLDYLKSFERSANLFPGFDVESQGIYRETEKDGTVRFYTYVVRE